MNNKFDQLAKGLAQSTTRRQALKKFGGGLAGMALACFGLTKRAEAGLPDKGLRGYCVLTNSGVYNGICLDPISCRSWPSSTCHLGRLPGGVASAPCANYDPTKICN